MRYAILVLVVLGFAAGLLRADRLAMSPANADEGEIAGIDWRTDLDAARAEARTSGRPLLVVFR